MIEVKDVYFTYPNGVEALKGVSLTISDGELVAIMGENGAGKTTLVKHFNGLLKPTKGDVFVDGVNTRNVSVATLSRNVGLVFQNPDHQLFSETVEEEIAFALRNFGFDEDAVRRRVAWALSLLGLTKYGMSSPLSLSEGERKRVALASVIAWDPKVLILDEPTIGQDYGQRRRLKRFILRMVARGKTVIVVTHDVEFVAECSPRVVLMQNGKVIADGGAREVLTDVNTLTKTSLIPPQVTQIFMELSDLGLPTGILDVREAKEALLKVLKGALK